MVSLLMSGSSLKPPSLLVATPLHRRTLRTGCTPSSLCASSPPPLTMSRTARRVVLSREASASHLPAGRGEPGMGEGPYSARAWQPWRAVPSWQRALLHSHSYSVVGPRASHAHLTPPTPPLIGTDDLGCLQFALRPTAGCQQPAQGRHRVHSLVSRAAGCLDEAQWGE